MLAALITGCGTTEPRPDGTDLVFAQVSVGGGQTCARTVAGAAYCWGNSLGTGTMTTQGTPVLVPSGLTFQWLSAGASHACGVATSGPVYCWGSNLEGELGIGAADTLLHATPVAVAGGLSFATVSVGYYHTCAVTAGGAAYCWGFNPWGELGNGSTTNSVTPAVVAGGLSFASVSAGYSHTCGMTASGAAYCWGTNRDGELGIGAADTLLHATPVAVAGGLSFATVGAGFYHTCGVTSAGVAYCWGANYSGQLGNGSLDMNPHPAPVPVVGGLVFQSVSAGESQTCGLTTSGAAYCWGNNWYDLLGDSHTTSSVTPAAVAGGFTFAAVGIGDHACGLTRAGAVHCWGAYVS